VELYLEKYIHAQSGDSINIPMIEENKREKRGRKEKRNLDKEKEYQLTWTSTSRFFPVLSQIVPPPHF
jgi:hypothetical protein